MPFDYKKECKEFYMPKNVLSIRLPNFVTEEDFAWAVKEATVKKKTDISKVEFLTYDEGLCVQCMHIGSYDMNRLQWMRCISIWKSRDMSLISPVITSSD